MKRPDYLKYVDRNKKVKDTFNSSAWLDTDVLGNASDFADTFKLVSVRNAIKNFVAILTNDPKIKVAFNTSGNSYTDGNTVTIGNPLTKTYDFDVTVGLALHEASHILLTDFSTLDVFGNMTLPADWLDAKAHRAVEDLGLPMLDYSITSELESHPHHMMIMNFVKSLVNYIEDRRIDAFVYEKAPGYRGYYDSLYVKYFYNKNIDKALLSKEHTDETVESYLFRIINMHNPNSKLGALKWLKKINELIDLPNINRLSDTWAAVWLAAYITKMVWFDLFNPNAGGSENEAGENEAGENEAGGSGSGAGENEAGGSENEAGENEAGGSGSGAGENEAGENEAGGSDFTPTEELSDRQRGLLKKAFEKQKEFIDGNIKKTKITKSIEKSIRDIEQSGAEMVNVGNEFSVSDGGWSHSISASGVNVIVVKKLTESLIDSIDFPLRSSSYASERNRGTILKGIRLGKILAKKMMTRSEERNTIYNRQKTGKIDSRMLASAGFGNENIFQFAEIDKYKKANLHISVDASGSMSGSKWEKTMVNVTALTTAATLIPNLEVQVSFRTVTWGNDGYPYVILAFDSTKDKLNKLKKFFPMLEPGGTTPEGLCFEAIHKNFIKTSNDVDSYFLNISDGEPFFTNRSVSYNGELATKHTASRVKKIKELGIKVLSYFVAGRDYHNHSSKERFISMYGTNAKFINVESVNEISKTMNKLFMEK